VRAQRPASGELGTHEPRWHAREGSAVTSGRNDVTGVRDCRVTADDRLARRDTYVIMCAAALASHRPQSGLHRPSLTEPTRASVITKKMVRIRHGVPAKRAVILFRPIDGLDDLSREGDVRRRCSP
jgi:hypothetical protein